MTFSQNITDLIEQRLKPAIVALQGRRNAIAGYTISTQQNVNAGAAGATNSVNWDGTPDREDADFTLATSIVTVAGTPDHTEISVNLSLRIDDAANVARPNQICRVTRVNDGKVLGVASTGYIRDSNDHEQASHNIKCIDVAPLANSQYEVTCQRETNNGGVVNTEPGECTFYLSARFIP